MSQGTKLFFKLLGKPAFTHKVLWAKIISSLVIIAFAQSALLLFLGPFLKGLFSLSQSQWIEVKDLFSPSTLRWIPYLENLKISTSSVAILIPTGLLFSGISRSIANYVYQASISELALSVISQFRVYLFRKILSQNFEELSQKNSGQWMSYLMNDLHFIQTRYVDILNSCIRDLVLMLSGYITMLVIHPGLGLFLLCISPFIAKKMGKTGSKISHFAHDYQKQLSLMAGYILELRKRLNFIKAQNGISYEKNRFLKINYAFYSSVRKSILTRTAFAPGVEFCGVLLFSGLILFLTKRSTLIAPSDLLVFFAATGAIMRPLRSMGEQLSKFHETTGALSKHAKLFKSEECFDKNIPLHKILPKLNLSFYIQKGRMQLRATDLHLHPGRSIVVLGPSGAGKSTLLKILAGLYQPQGWQGSLTQKELALNTAYIGQTSFLFTGSIRENLCYGSPKKVTEEQIWESLNLVGLDQEIRSFSNQLDTQFHGIAESLSGGQKQRLSIARILLSGKALWLLDEVSSAIDSHAEGELMKKLLTEAHSRKICVIAVTHRMEWIHLFDEKLTIHSGKITQESKLGTYATD